MLEAERAASASAAQACHVLDILEAAERARVSGAREAVRAAPDVALPRLPRALQRAPRGTPRIIFGVTALAGLAKPAAFALLDQAWALGLTAFDSAHVYGPAETMLGTWLRARQVPREAVFPSPATHAIWIQLKAGDLIHRV